MTPTPIQRPGLLLVALLLVSCAEDTPPAGEVLRPVRTLTVPNAAAERERTFSGVSRSTQESRLSFKVSGTVVELPVQVGDQLDAGDLVARIDPAPYELQAQQAQAALVQAQAAARNAAANYERVKGLYENSNASRNDLDAARAASESAEAQVRAAGKALELARLNVSYTRLVAGSACTVASVEVEVNENVATGTPVAVVNCGEGLEVSLDVPESLIAALRQGMAARIQFAAVPDRHFAGTVTEVGIATTPNASTFPVIVRVAESDPALRAGLAAQVTLAFPTAGGRKLQILPLSAVARDPEGTFVYLAIPGDPGQAVVTRRAVKLGELTEAGVEVLSGLSPGEQVITAGVSVVRPGQRVLLRP